jgi:hypothetical protein
MEHKCENWIYVEELWDYDWILYKKCKECWKKINTHTWIEFDFSLTREEYWLLYQFYKKELVWYSIYKASWLLVYEDLNFIENRLWWTRWVDWEWKLIFKPLKDLTKNHIKNIIKDYNNWKLKLKDEYLDYLNKRLCKQIKK